MVSRESSKLGELVEKNATIEQINRSLYMFNIYLILCKTLITKSHNDKLISDIINFLDNVQFQTIFYNSISIFKILIPTKDFELLKKDEIAQRKWMISSHFDYAIKIKYLAKCID